MNQSKTHLCKLQWYVAVMVIMAIMCWWLPQQCSAQSDVVKDADQQLRIPNLELGTEYMDEVYRILPSYEGEYFVVLNSGLTVLVQELEYAPVVSCRATIRAGSIYEEEYLGYGISHFVEHIVSQGTTAQRSEEENMKLVDKLGGASNASTSLDQTTYFINTTPGHWKTAMELLTSFITSCVFDPDEVNREKEVILQEFKLGQNNPRKQLWYLFSDTVYQKNNAKYPTIGYEELFKKLTREDLITYYNKRYQPQNTVFSVAGNIEGPVVLKEIIDMTRGFTRRSVFDMPLPEEDKQITPRWAEKVHPSARLTSMYVGIPTVSLHNADLYALDVLGMILGSGQTSRLYRSLKDDKELVLSVSGFNWTPSFARGVMMISMNLPYENIDPAVDALWNAVEDVRLNGVTIEELDRAKQKIITDQIYDSLKAESITSNLAYSYLITGDPHFDDRYVNAIQNVSLDDVKQVAQRYLDRSKQSVALIKPQQEPIADTVAEDEQPAIISVKKTELANGMSILLKPVDAYPLVHFTLFLKGGLIYEDPAQNGVSNFVSNMLTRGTTTRTKEEIARIIENIGGKLTTESGNNTCDVRCTVMKDDVFTGMELIADVVLYPSFPADEIEKLRKDTLLAIEKLDESWSTEVLRLYKSHYYEEHPYKYDTIGSRESVSALTREDLIEFYQKIYVPENMVLAVYGNFDENKILDEIRAIFETLPSGDFTEVDLPDETGNQLEESTTVEKEGDKYSASFIIGYPGISLYNKDKYVFDVIDAAISGIGYPSGWLQDRLRGGDANLVYLVHGFPQFGVDAGYFGIISQTTLKNYHEVVNIITGSITELKEQGLSDEELTMAKNTCITMNDMSRETIAAQAYNDALYEVLGLGFEYDFKYPENINAVTAGDVLRVANEYFTKSLTVTVFPQGYEEQLANEQDNETVAIPDMIETDINTP